MHATSCSQLNLNFDLKIEIRNRFNKNKNDYFQGDSEFWRRKMRTLHRIMDVNHDGVISYDDFTLLAKRFSDLGHLSEDVAAEFNEVIKQTWEEQFGEITPYNLVTAEQFLTDLHHRLNDKKMAKRIGRFLPYLFKVNAELNNSNKYETNSIVTECALPTGRRL